MMSENLNKELASRLAALRDGAGEVSANDIQALIDAVMTHAPAEIVHGDHALYAEIKSLADAISRARSDIANLRPQEISEEFIPNATDELDAVVGATEQATHTIMDSAELIENLAPQMPPEISEKIENAVTEIYSACSFQDITGQRITKVVGALKEIEAKVDSLLRALAGDLEKGEAGPGRRKRAPDPADESTLLNGPALPAEARNQADIDKLFSGEG